eukprot:12931025-Prorocentrum_lima.AAC.1
MGRNVVAATLRSEMPHSCGRFAAWLQHPECSSVRLGGCNIVSYNALMTAFALHWAPGAGPCWEAMTGAQAFLRRDN